MKTLLLLTAPPTTRLAWHSVALAQQLLQQGASVQVFFYQDAVSIANRLCWRPADEPSLAAAWRALHIELPVCVSAALLRGVSDHDNATRHGLSTDNLAEGFRLTGLGELAEQVLNADRVIHL
ncbi:MAG: sulfurtransferase complex subunit TusD [Pseudomonadota bacterium]|nr:sulfurtransferase complex subunit TusD [Pseudomonadota bacterium]